MGGGGSKGKERGIWGFPLVGYRGQCPIGGPQGPGTKAPGSSWVFSTFVGKNSTQKVMFHEHFKVCTNDYICSFVNHYWLEVISHTGFSVTVFLSKLKGTAFNQYVSVVY